MLQVFLDIPPILKDIPYSTIFIFALAALVSMLTTLVNRRFTDPEKSRAWRKEIADWSKDMRAAQRSNDKKALAKVMKNQQYIMKLQSKMMWQSMKVSLLFLVPLFIMWQVLGGFYTHIDQATQQSAPLPLAYFPGIGATLPLPMFNYSLIWWYLICSLLFGTLFQHAFGLIEVSE
jgi:uncharacterized membrane protein (DUF106 family)